MDGKPANAFYGIDTENDSIWETLPDFPGIPRIQPVMAAVEHNGKRFVYLFGGFFGGNSENKPAMATEVLRYDTETRVWETVGKQIDEETGAFFSLAGATAMPVDNRYILCLGGVNHDIFLDAITSQHNIANNTQ